MGKGIRGAVLFLSTTSLSYEDAPLGWYSAPGIGHPEKPSCFCLPPP